jgi:hypothetical protein
MHRTQRFAILLLMVVLSTTATTVAAPLTTTATQRFLPTVAASETTAAPPPFYAFYYLWWSMNHWKEKLGSNYPYNGSWPLPGRINATTGCGATSLYTGSTVFDIPSAGPADQSASGVIARDVRAAAASGLTGFMAGWRGTGNAGQLVTDTPYSKRLDILAREVGTYNQNNAAKFQYVIDYQTFHNVRTVDHVANDIDYLLARYGRDTAWGRMGGRLVFRWSNTRNYPTATLQAIYNRYGSRLFIIGEERATTWTTERARYLDGTGHYWSTQDPYRNPASFDQTKAFAAKVRATGRQFFAPLTPGYNDELHDKAEGDAVDAGDCVPRKGTTTMRTLYRGNRAANPNGWFVISWNEWVEHTYIQPSKRYGMLYVNELKRIIAESRAGG